MVVKCVYFELSHDHKLDRISFDLLMPRNSFNVLIERFIAYNF